MCTVRSAMPWPGTLAANSSETPSSGWMWQTRTFGRRAPSSTTSNGGGGRGLGRAGSEVTDEAVRLRAPALTDLERRVRPALDLDRDRRPPPREPLSGAHVER